MPGVVVTTATRSGPSASLRAPSGQFMLVGMTERGDHAAPTTLRSMSDVERYLGTRQSYGAAYDQLKIYFSEGGLQAQFVRVVGPAASKGTLTLMDRAVTPVATLKIDAQNAGAWSSNLTVQVLDGSGTDTFRIVLRLNDLVVEDVNNLQTPDDAVNAFKQSPFIRVTDLGSATSTPANRPAVLAETPLSAGDDDRAAVVDTHYLTALNLITDSYGDGAVAIPGQTGATIWDGIIEHCKVNNRVGLLAAVVNETISNLKTAAASLDSEYAGLFAPWIVVSDGGSGTRNLSPEGFVAACRARAHEKTGPWRPGAGAIGIGNTVLDVVQDFKQFDGDDLNAAKVSVIRKIANTVRLYGWKSLSIDTMNWEFLKDRDFLNRLVVEATEVLEKYVFAPIDGKGQLLSQINSELVGMLEPYKKAGGLFPLMDANGNELDPGYNVDTSSAVNTGTSLGNNEVRALVQVRISPVGETISLNIVKVGFNVGL